MHTLRVPLAAFCLLLGASFYLSAENPRALLSYYSDPSEITVYDFSGVTQKNLYPGYPLLIGYAVRTGGCVAELKLTPNGSIVRISENSFFKIEEMTGTPNAKANIFALIKGLIRMVASKKYDEAYMVRTPGAVLGVRGTDFEVSVDPDQGGVECFVYRGSVEAYNPDTGTKAYFQDNQGIAIRDQALSLIDRDMAEVKKRMDEFKFTSLKPAQVKDTAPKWYSVTFNYAASVDYKEWKQFFAADDYFADYQKYLARFRSYYEQEMKDFKTRYSSEMDAFRKSMEEEKKQY
ncbi:MAG: hypothetical protein E4H36_08065 [Spirochaetales bacterium]|nr:MAG: hypothetical protein E4H36_08065 [Spirochaetales bacterium]